MSDAAIRGRWRGTADLDNRSKPRILRAIKRSDQRLLLGRELDNEARVFSERWNDPIDAEDSSRLSRCGYRRRGISKREA